VITLRGALVLFLFATACGSGASSDEPDAPPPGTPDAAVGDPPGFRVDKAGTISLIEGSGVYAALFDRPYDQPLPIEIVSSGDCTVYRRPTPSCPAGCGADACVADNQCAPYAVFASAGDLTITGLREPATLVPSPFGYTMPPLPDDLFADDAAIHVAAAGAALPAFTADVGGVAPLALALSGAVELRDGEDEIIRWTSAAGGARIQLALALGWHGAPWTDLLLCETADDGELVVPAAAVNAMPYFEVGFAQSPSWIARFRRAWVTTPAGPIEIIAASQLPLGLTHLP
jgi:hypothetical protein